MYCINYLQTAFDLFHRRLIKINTSPYVLFRFHNLLFSMTQQPLVGQGLLISEA